MVLLVYFFSFYSHKQLPAAAGLEQCGQADEIQDDALSLAILALSLSRSQRQIAKQTVNRSLNIKVNAVKVNLQRNVYSPQ